MKKFIAVFLLLLWISAASASNDRALFWEVTSPKDAEVTASVYLLGSIHFADDSFYPLRQTIEDAYDSSDHLVVEIDISKTDPAQYTKIISEKGEYKGDEGIEDHISPETMLSLIKQLKTLNIPISVVRKSRPGVLVMTLSMVQALNLGFSPELGIDYHFLHKDKSKDVIELESVEEQLDLLINMAEGELLLKEMLNSMDKSSGLIKQLMSIWKEGDEMAMAKLLFVDALKEYPSFSAVYEKMFFERNVKMANKIKQFFKTDDSYFVIVGAGHFVGEKGIVQLLLDEGYGVERL